MGVTVFPMSHYPTFSVCPDHGYLPGEQYHAVLREETEVWSRVVGFIARTELEQREAERI